MAMHIQNNNETTSNNSHSKQERKHDKVRANWIKFKLKIQTYMINPIVVGTDLCDKTAKHSTRIIQWCILILIIAIVFFLSALFITSLLEAVTITYR